MQYVTGFEKMAFHPKFFVNVFIDIDPFFSSSDYKNCKSSDESLYIANNCFSREISLLSALSTFQYSRVSHHRP